MAGPAMRGPHLCGSSLKGWGSIADFFHILDHLITTENADGYKLQQLHDELRPLAGPPPLERSSLGNIVAGNYLIGEFPQAINGELIHLRNLAAKRAKRNEGGSAATVRSTRDPSDDSQSFKTRLVYRDKGCAICLAAGSQEIYECHEDSDRYQGSHIIDFAYQKVWDIRGFSALVSDPFTNPANAGNQFASPSTRTKDLGRINSLENGMLLCLQHHEDYHNFRFAINLHTHEIFSFHPATAKLQGVEVTAPWARRDVLYPAPHPGFLEMHYFTSVSKTMKGSGDTFELDDDDEDFEELSELKRASENLA